MVRRIIEVLNEDEMGMSVTVPKSQLRSGWYISLRQRKTIQGWRRAIRKACDVVSATERDPRVVQKFEQLHEYVRRDRKNPTKIRKLRIILEITAEE